MPPRAVPLAFAGRKLTGPPEGYGKKKELQVKHWISGLPALEDTELAEVASVSTLPQVEASREDLYRSLRDSTDGYGPAPSAPSGRERLVSPTAHDRASQGADVPPTRAAVVEAGGMVDSARAAAATTTLDGGNAKPAAGGSGTAVNGRLNAPASLRSSLTASEHVAPKLRTLPQAGATAAATAPLGTAAEPRLADAPLELIGSSSRRNASVEVAAGLLLARVEATLLPGQAPEEKYRRALLVALEDQERFQASIQRELAAVREQAATARTEAQARAAEAQAGARRAELAEAELARTRAEALAQKQEVQRLKADFLDGRAEQSEAVARTQAELALAITQLNEHSARATQAMNASTAEAATARQAALALQKELTESRRQAERDKLRMQAQIAALQAELAREKAAAAAAHAERDRSVEALQAEAAARKAAEESERKALRAAAKQAEVQEIARHAAAAGAVARQRVATAAQRAAIVSVEDPAAAAVAVGGTHSNGLARAGTGSPSRSRTPAAAQASPAATIPARAELGGSLRKQSPEAQVDDVAAARVNGHRTLGRALAAERRQLGEVFAATKRATAAAELADARAVEAALSSAPDALRTLGLAFRAYLVVGEGGAPQGSAAAGLAARLSGAGYRVYMDPLAAQAGGADVADEIPSTPLVGVSAAVVVLAAPGLLQKPLASGELAAASRLGCPLVVLAPPGLDLGAVCVREGPPASAQPEATLQLDEAEAALRDAWPNRLEHAPNSPSAATAIGDRLGLPDSALAMLPDEYLRLLAANRTRAVPDLRYLNVPLPDAGPGIGGLQHLRLNFAADAAAASPKDGPADAPRSGSDAGPLVELLCAVLRGNTTLTALTLRGCPPDASRTIAGAVLASPTSRVAAITASMRVPLAALAGRLVGAGDWKKFEAIDLGAGRPGQQEPVMGDADAAVVAEALRARAEAESAAGSLVPSLSPPLPPLVSLSMPSSSGHHLGEVAVASLVDALAALPGLKHLNGVALEGVVAAATAQALAGTANAGGRRSSRVDTAGSPAEGGSSAVLDLSATRCGPVVLGLVAKRIQPALSSLSAINLTGCDVGPYGAARLSAAAGTGGLPALEAACVADNQLGPKGTAALLEAMLGSGRVASSSAPAAACADSPCGALCTILDLSLNALGDAGCKALARGLASLSSLRVLVLSHNVIGTEGARALAGGLTSCSGLQELLLAGNHFGDVAARELAAGLRRLPALQALNLADNQRVSADGVASLAAALPSLPNLTELDLSRVHGGDDGARYLAKALSAHPRLSSLALDGFKLRAEGAEHLGCALEAHPGLTRLILSRNHLGDRGASYIAEALGRNACLAALDLRSCGIGLAGCRSLDGVLRNRNSTLQRLDTAGNEVDEDVLQALHRLAASQRAARPQPGKRASAFPHRATARQPHATRQTLPTRDSPAVEPERAQHLSSSRGEDPAAPHGDQPRFPARPAPASPQPCPTHAARSTGSSAALSSRRTASTLGGGGVVLSAAADADFGPMGDPDVAGDDLETLEALLSRYRASSPAVGAGLDLGYTGMSYS